MQYVKSVVCGFFLMLIFSYLFPAVDILARSVGNQTKEHVLIPTLLVEIVYSRTLESHKCSQKCPLHSI